MNETPDRILAELEDVTDRMATGGIPCLDDFVVLTARRDELVRQWAEHPGTGADVAPRLGALVRQGAEAESRLRALRDAVRREMDAVDKTRRLAHEIAGMITSPPHAVNLKA